MTKSQEIKNLKYELACMKFQRDALLEMTWLDLPAEPDEESTKEWKRLFDEGWERRAVLDFQNAGAVAPPPQMPDSTNDAPGG